MGQVQTLRVIGGAWRGRRLAAPAGTITRPTNIRARQAVFDMLLHAGWAGPELISSARVLDVFAGTGAYGLEALSRGAGFATFIENDPAARAALRANIAACDAAGVTRIIAADALAPPPGTPYDLVFLDPPYARNLIPATLVGLGEAGYLKANPLFVAELGPDDVFMPENLLAMRQHGKARVMFWR